MKKTIIISAICVLVFGVMFFSKYFEFRQKYNEAKIFNSKYEKFLDKEILGTDITTIINHAVDDNEKAFVKKDKNGKYIPNDENSIIIEIETKDLGEDKIFPMEIIYDSGMTEFVKYYREIAFKCKKIEYNSQKKVKYMLFTQVTQ